MGKSTKKVWWKCQKGHEWQASIRGRTIRGNNCPCCAGKIPILGETDLATLFPNIVLEWDYEKNEKTPEQFTAYSQKNIYWKCSACNYSWKAVIYNRTHGSRCPRCRYHG